MNAVIEQINSLGRAFVDFAWPMLWQSGLLIVLLLSADFAIRRRVRAVFRYWLWMLVFIKLVLPTTLSSPVSVGQLVGKPLAAIKISSKVQPALSKTKQPVGGAISNAETLLPNEAKIVEAGAALSPATDIYKQPIEPAASLTWQGGIFMAWLIVVCAMILLLLQRALFVCGLVRQAHQANDLMKDMLGFCCKMMGVKGRIGLRVSPNATSPAVCGLFRPAILLPHGLASNIGSGQFKVVLMHELAHIKRGDLWVNLLQMLLQIVYFYNPLLWAANWIIRRVREQAVDEAVQVALGEKAQLYPETLLNIARLAFKRPALSLRLIGVVESRGALTCRIRRILTRPIPRTAKLGLIGLSAIIFFAAILLPMAKAVPPPEFLIKGTVTDAQTGKPVAGAKVGDEKYSGGTQFAYTDANGNYSYKTWPEEHNISIQADGYQKQIKGFHTRLFPLDLLEKEKTINFQITPYGAQQSAEAAFVDEQLKNQLNRDPIISDLEKKISEQELLLAKVRITSEANNLEVLQLQEFISSLKEEKQKRETVITGQTRRAAENECLNKLKPDSIGAFRPRQEANSGFKATLSNGATVELVGISDYPTDSKKWWRPDGNLIDLTYEVKGSIEHEKGYQKLFLIARVDANEKNPAVKFITPGATRSGIGRNVYENQIKVEDLWSYDFEMDSIFRTAHIKAGVACGQWETISAVISGFKESQKNETDFGQVEWLKVADENNEVIVYVSNNFSDIAQFQVIAEDVTGKTYSSYMSNCKGNAGLMSCEYKFHISPENVKKFLFQVRPYEWVEFKNISLKPNVKAEVKIVGGLSSKGNKEAPLVIAPAEFGSQTSGNSNKPKVISISPPSGSLMALMSELKITFDLPMMPKEFNVIDAALDKNNEAWGNVGVISPFCSYDANNNTFTLLLALPGNWNGQAKLCGFKNIKGIEADDVVIDYHTLRDGFSKDLQEKFEKERQSPELKQLLKKIKEARADIFSLSERISQTYDFDTYKKTESIIIKMNKGGRFFADMNGVFDNPWSIGSDGNQCWFYYCSKDGNERLTTADFKDVNEKNISICDLFGLNKNDIDKILRSNSLEYGGAFLHDGQQCYIIRLWKAKASSNYATCDVDEWLIESKKYMPVRMTSYSIKGKITYEYSYNSINSPIADSEFKPDSLTKAPGVSESLGEGYDTRFINIIDGTINGRMSISWGKKGLKGTYSSGMN